VTRACRVWLLLALMLTCQLAHAQESMATDALALPWWEAGAAAFDRTSRYALDLQLRGGGATTPFFTTAFPSARGHGLVLQLGGAYRLRRDWLLDVQMPLVILSLAQPAGSYVDVFSWGNPNISARWRRALWQGARFALHGVAGASLALPIAQQGPSESLFGLRALQVASAMDGLRSQELYTSGVIPIAGSAALLLERIDWGFEGSLRVPVFARFSRAGLGSDAAPRWVATTPVLHFAARYAPVRWVALSLAADTVFNGRAPVAAAQHAATIQFTLQPALTFPMRERWLLRSEFVLPLAGPLGGHAYAGALQLAFQR
jgi:hypothetical protein